MHRLCPHPAAIVGALPRRVAEREWVWGELVGVGIRAEEVGDDLDGHPEETRKQGGFRARVVDGPGSAGARGQANIALRTHPAAQQKRGVARRRRNGRGSSWGRDCLSRHVGGRAECASGYESRCEQSSDMCSLFGLLTKVTIHFVLFFSIS